MDLVVHADRVKLLTSWDQVLAKGSARCLVRLVDDPDVTVALYGLDLREAHGIVLTLFAPADASAGGSAVRVQRAPKPPPRFATMVKDERSFVVEDRRGADGDPGLERGGDGGPSLARVHPPGRPRSRDRQLDGHARVARARAAGCGCAIAASDGSWVWFEVTNHNLLDDPEQALRGRRDGGHLRGDGRAGGAARARAAARPPGRGAPARPFAGRCGARVVYTNDRLHEILGVRAWRAPSTSSWPPSWTADRPRAASALAGRARATARARDIEVALRLPPTRGAAPLQHQPARADARGRRDQRRDRVRGGRDRQLAHARRAEAARDVRRAHRLPQPRRRSCARSEADIAERRPERRTRGDVRRPRPLQGGERPLRARCRRRAAARRRAAPARAVRDERPRGPHRRRRVPGGVPGHRRARGGNAAGRARREDAARVRCACGGQRLAAGQHRRGVVRRRPASTPTRSWRRRTRRCTSQSASAAVSRSWRRRRRVAALRTRRSACTGAAAAPRRRRPRSLRW